MDAPPDEARLIERSRTGDLEAFNAIVLAYQDRVFNLCLRMLGHRQAAEDATQEVFISAYRAVARMRGTSVRAWLLRIASNTCIDEIRRRKRQPAMSLDADDARPDDPRRIDVADDVPGPEALALQSELGAALQAELLRLPDDQRLAIILSDIEGLDYGEIAQAMSCSLGTVKSRISRGRSRLREQLRGKRELFGDAVRHTE
jgi:RNA polymerase sigma-70 factor (ECF subfamily)